MKLRRKYKLGYGILSIADQCLYFMFGTFFLFFLTTVVDINPMVAGVIASIGALWDAVSAVVVGNISDNYNGKMGKRRPFILFSAVPMAIITVLLFTKVELPYEFKIIYYIVMTLLFWSGFATFFIPILAWGAELTEDYDERTVLRGFAYGGNTLGMAVGAVLPTIFVDYFMNSGKSLSVSWQLSALLIGIFVVVSLWFGLYLLKDVNTEEKISIDNKNSKMNFSEELKSVLKIAKEIIRMPSLFFLIGGSILYLGANTIFVADRIYYYTFNMGLNPEEITWLMMIEPFAGLVFLPIIYFSSKLLDKKQQYITGMLISGISMIALRFFDVDTFFEAGYMLIVFGLGAICYWQLMPSMIYDVCQLDMLKTGNERQGAIVSLQVFSESTSEALGLILLGVLLEISGFQGSSSIQSENALFQVSNGFTLIPGIFMILSAYMVYRYPISKKVFNDIKRALKLKEKGEYIDLEEFRKY